ncbi:hypothetical protein PIB30_033725 [Stylosanthes scabra]|uniref:Transposase (putative) gypsy type domain-containing protein n=1 Tax=Stylosanthes scabra TaxID=79078 RepID=A0ABU6ZB78_9FABA|nr:hypothetical protein [Stylosanthes scabra]
MLNENIVFAPNYSTKYKLEVPNVNERICFINHRAVDVSDWLWVYDYLFTRVGICISLTSFQQEILRQSGVAPSHLRPNSWAFIRSFELVCQALGLLVSWRLFFFFSTLTAPKNANMDDSGRGFFSFRAHGKMKIFNFSDESSSFKEIEESKVPPLLAYGVPLAPALANELSEEEKNAASLLQTIWGKENLAIKNMMCDDETAKNVAVDMAGGLATLVAMRRKLIAKEQSEGDKSLSPSVTVDLIEETPMAPEQIDTDKSEGRVSSPEAIPEHSPSQKRKRVQKEASEESKTKKALGDLEADDRLVLVQRMLLRVIVYYQDVQRENAKVPSLRTLLSKKEESNKSLGSRVADLEVKMKSRDAEILRLEGLERTLGDKAKKFEDEKRALEEGKRATEKKVTDLLASLKKAQEDLASMEKMKEEAGTLAMNRVSEIEKNVLEKLRLLAPGVDFSRFLRTTRWWMARLWSFLLTSLSLLLPKF